MCRTGSQSLSIANQEEQQQKLSPIFVAPVQQGSWSWYVNFVFGPMPRKEITCSRCGTSQALFGWCSTPNPPTSNTVDKPRTNKKRKMWWWCCTLHAVQFFVLSTVAVQYSVRRHSHLNLCVYITVNMSCLSKLIFHGSKLYFHPILFTESWGRTLKHIVTGCIPFLVSHNSL